MAGRIDTDNTVTLSNGKQGFGCGDSTTIPPIPPTKVSVKYMNALQEELCTFIEDRGITLDLDNYGQFKQALILFMAEGILGEIKGDKLTLAKTNGAQVIAQVDSATDGKGDTTIYMEANGSANLQHLIRVHGPNDTVKPDVFEMQNYENGIYAKRYFKFYSNSTTGTNANGLSISGDGIEFPACNIANKVEQSYEAGSNSLRTKMTDTNKIFRMKDNGSFEAEAINGDITWSASGLTTSDDPLTTIALPTAITNANYKSATISVASLTNEWYPQGDASEYVFTVLPASNVARIDNAAVYLRGTPYSIEVKYSI